MKTFYRAAAVFLVLITLTSCYLYYLAIDRWAGAIRANRVLSAALVEAQEKNENKTLDLNGLPVELAVLDDGSIVVRLNKDDNFTVMFPGVCGRTWRKL